MSFGGGIGHVLFRASFSHFVYRPLTATRVLTCIHMHKSTRAFTPDHPSSAQARTILRGVRFGGGYVAAQWPSELKSGSAL